ncbi:MAG: energy transducer TonB [Bacteroidales bacterium]|nr:energy transducer TonB [Bacteroidales bacterium]
MKTSFLRILIIICAVVWSLGAQAQKSIDLINDNYDASNDEVFHSSGHMPSFPGGDVALMKFIKDNMIYPYEALKNRIEGKVIIQFVVTKTGKVGKVKVARSVNKELDQEAVRLIKMLPDFSPGRNNVGEPVNVWYILPVIFKLPDNN